MRDCPFESDLLDAIASHRWPAKAEADLRAHVASCENCADLAAVAAALLCEEDVAFAEARVPSSAAVWHRAQLRSREEAVRAAARPIGFVQGVAFSLAIAGAIAAAVWGLPIIAALLPDLSLNAIPRPSISLPQIDVDPRTLLSNGVIQIAALVWAVLIPTALYFTLRETKS